MEQYIKIQRIPYEEPYHLNLVVEASNGVTHGKLEYYCNASDLHDIGKRLKNFPKNFPNNSSDEYIYSLGSEKEEDRFAFYIHFKFYTIDSVGNCAVQLKINNNEKSPDENRCTFSINTKVADINRLGDLFIGFSKLKHSELIWKITSGELR